jgi:phage protein D
MSLDSLPPGAAPSTDVVTRKVFINNTVLSDEILLGQLSVNKSFNKVAYAKLVFIDGAVADRNFTLSSDNTFKPGNEIRVQLGYHGNVETVFEGIIIKQAIKRMELP